MSTLSYSRWIFLLSLAALMFISLSEVESFSPIIKLDCCQNLSNRTFPRIKQCYEQKRLNCNIHAFIIKNHKGRLRCIDPKSEELRTKIKKMFPWFNTSEPHGQFIIRPLQTLELICGGTVKVSSRHLQSRINPEV